MKLNNISIRTRFFLLLTGTVIFWLIAGLFALSLMDKLSRYQGIDRKIGTLHREILRMENSVQYFYSYDLPSESFHESGRSEGLSRFTGAIRNAGSLLGELKNEAGISGNPVIRQKLNKLLEYLEGTDDLMKTMVDRTRQRGWKEYGLNGVLEAQIKEFETGLSRGTGQQWQDLLSGARLYLAAPGSVQLNALLNRINEMRSTLPGTPAGPAARSAGTGSMISFLDNLRELLQMDLELGTTRYEGLRSRVSGSIRILDEEAEALAVLFSIEHQNRIRQIRWGMISLVLLSASIYAILLYLFSRSIRRGLHALGEFTSKLVEGRFPENSPADGNDEFSVISGHLGEFVQSLKNKAGFAAQLAGGKNPAPLQALGPEDSLANSLINLQKSLQSARMEEEKHQKARDERRWTSEGMAKFGDILRIHNKDTISLSENVIRELVNYLNASAGGIFLVNRQEEEPLLELVACFAYDRKKHLKQGFRFGEGLVGTCAIEKEKIFLTEIPEDFIQIVSGLGESKPGCLLLIPLQLEDVTLGVIEIASLKTFANFEIDFVENLAGSIASAVSTVQMNMRTALLLEQSQQQARDMAKQEEIMRQNMEELQTTQEESARRESEISGILNGIHNSSLVAEFNMQEELISMNDKFLQLLELQQTQLIGRKYNEIVGVSRHTDSYREFWQGISEGNTITRIDKIAVLTGHEVWLRQTFTPIRDKDGNPFKVLNIAADITETVEQKESLEKQSGEIRRANIEMKSFSDAVDQALIKCVYSPAGQILEVNENFENVTGFTEKELLGKNNRAFLQRIEKEQFDRIWDDILKDKPYSGVIRRTKPTGEEVWLMSTFTPVKDENGNIFKVFFLGQDITERKLKYQLLEEANREIERLRRQLDEKK
jgi:PAS domain S-box-containing protein